MPLDDRQRRGLDVLRRDLAVMLADQQLGRRHTTGDDVSFADLHVKLIENGIRGGQWDNPLDREVVIGFRLFLVELTLDESDRRSVLDRVAATCRHVDGENEENQRRDCVKEHFLDPLEAEWFPPPITP